ncbi:unnamed protein product [Thelazia callipaeda]|uniref:Uncharacterized protein n=1 Tax=Thelazia callipaeda TaxID=103827 RepID=A0A0N5CSI6_THECL|nr:unnamed protein product [Thelazia callipaeda]
MSVPLRFNFATILFSDHKLLFPGSCPSRLTYRQQMSVSP